MLLLLLCVGGRRGTVAWPREVERRSGETVFRRVYIRRKPNTEIVSKSQTEVITSSRRSYLVLRINSTYLVYIEVRTVLTPVQCKGCFYTLAASSITPARTAARSHLEQSVLIYTSGTDGRQAALAMASCSHTWNIHVIRHGRNTCWVHSMANKPYQTKGCHNARILRSTCCRCCSRPYIAE